MLGNDVRDVLVSAGHNVIPILRSDADLCDSVAVTHIFSQHPDTAWAINCAAYTAVDKAESEGELADTINGIAVGNLASLCQKHAVRLIHFSTDYVFNGLGDRPYLETDICDPTNRYGVSKRAGELAYLENGVGGYLFRVQWLFGRHGMNFISRISELAKERGALSVVGDQWGSPTWTVEIARAVLAMITHQPPEGLYHFASQGYTSWFDFAQYFLKLQTIACTLTSISTEAYPTPAKRPLNSRLNCRKFLDLGIFAPLSWEDSVKNYLKQGETRCV